MLKTTHLTRLQKIDIILSQYRLGRPQAEIAREVEESEEYVGDVLEAMYTEKVPVFPDDEHIIFAKEKIKVAKDYYDKRTGKKWKDISDWWL